MDDDEHLALAIHALCDAFEIGSTDAGARIKAVELARRQAQVIINRAKEKHEKVERERDD